jgi:hypothetical protein
MTDQPAAPDASAPVGADVYAMSPEQAGARLAEIGAAYKAAQIPADAVAPPPPGESATTPAQARALLNARKSDPQWRSRVLTSGTAEAREFQELTTLANDTAPDVLIETVNAIDDPLAQPRAVREEMLDGLRQAGMNEYQESILRQIENGNATADVPEGDGIAARRAIDKLMRDPELREAWLSRSNSNLDRVMFALNWAISNSQKDGRPMSQKARDELGALGLL